MSWIEGIFGLRKTEKELECEQRISTFNHSLELRGMLRKDLEEFRDRFRIGDVFTNSAIYIPFGKRTPVFIRVVNCPLTSYNTYSIIIYTIRYLQSTAILRNTNTFRDVITNDH